MPSAYVRAEASWLAEPEPVEACDWCGNDPCSCDADYDIYCDERLLDD